MNVAIPQLDEAVAPCFEAATSFLLATATEGGWERTGTVSCKESGGYRRVRLLLFHGVELLICSGINATHRDTLSVAGVNVISGVNLSVIEALEKLASGKLKAAQVPRHTAGLACHYSHEQLVIWTRELFAAGGYEVLPCPGEDSILIDLVAEIDCPVCHRRVRVAICCCAHTYSSQQEIREFHHATAPEFDARVYICPAEDQILESCHEYGIEVIDPKSDPHDLARCASGRLPVLKSTVAGHERASGAGTVA